ncbi:hypothetical protein KSP40_PGU000284 [Platanthera guangdongensis]|uniref:Uncharacterized protein n=1 Tax=Platanthera guangdongensis TaxID=2320717 RepID=A0ABR2LSE2_9ASPA
MSFIDYGPKLLESSKTTLSAPSSMEKCKRFAKQEASGAHPEDLSSDEMSDEEYGSSDVAVVGKADP